LYCPILKMTINWKNSILLLVDRISPHHGWFYASHFKSRWYRN
jgi:hypothetical protein